MGETCWYPDCKVEVKFECIDCGTKSCEIHKNVDNCTKEEMN